MYDEFLKQIGLTDEQSKVYQALLKGGLLPASQIALLSSLKRPLTYKILEQLISYGLIEKREQTGKIALFFPHHPSSLHNLIKRKEDEAKTAEAALASISGKLTSDFNLFSGRPNVQFFEGSDGMKKVLADSLTSESEILTYADIEAIQKYIPKENEEYVTKREKFNIKKRAIILDTPFSRKFLDDYHRDITDIKLISHKAEPFGTVMQIYDNKVSYLTLSDKAMIGIIVEDKNIYTMHKYLFEHLWEITEAFKSTTTQQEQVVSNTAQSQ